MRRPDWLAHANGATGLLGATIVVSDTKALPAAYERLFGAGSVQMTDDIVPVHVGRQRLIFAGPEDFAALYPEIEPDPRLAAPFIALLTVSVGDIEATTDHLANWHIAFEAAAHGRLLVPPEEASGTHLEFVVARR